MSYDHEWHRKTRAARKAAGLCTCCGKKPRGEKGLECDPCRLHRNERDRKHKERYNQRRRKVVRPGSALVGSSDAARIVALIEVAEMYMRLPSTTQFKQSLDNMLQDAVAPLRLRARTMKPPSNYTFAIPMVRERKWRRGTRLQSSRWDTEQEIVAVLPEVVIIKVVEGRRSRDFRVVDALPIDARETI